MNKGLERLYERARMLLSGGSVPVIEGERPRQHYHGIDRPALIHWQSRDLITNRRKNGSRRGNKAPEVPISKDRSQI